MFCSKTIWRKSIAVAVVPAPSEKYKILEHILLYELNYLSFLEAFCKLFLLKKRHNIENLEHHDCTIDQNWHVCNIWHCDILIAFE